MTQFLFDITAGPAGFNLFAFGVWAGVGTLIVTGVIEYVRR